ncbi:MAG: SIR2 family protein [Campylobacterales bacterium]
MADFDVVSKMKELREQLSHSKKIGCFFGAGTSMAMGLPGITVLTENVIGNFTGDDKEKIAGLLEHIKTHSPNGDKATIEDLLNHVRMIRQITYEKKDIDHFKINGENAVELDRKICGIIHKQLSEKEDEITAKANGLKTMQKFIAWYNWSVQDYSRELFTLNYDLIIEKSMESLQIPFFDGFVGAYEPFFHTESVEEIDRSNKLPNGWTRLWKLHGSLGWYWKKEQNGARVIRLGAQKPHESLDELVIYPSKDKYESSRKQPFLTYLDRLRNYLRGGEALFIIAGYSFSDEHINEIIFSSLRQNNRLHALTFLFDNESLEKIRPHAERIPNLALYGPNSAVIGGVYGAWGAQGDSFKPTYWKDNGLALGDFNILVNYLLEISGKKNDVEKEIEKALEKNIPNPVSVEAKETDEK